MGIQHALLLVAGLLAGADGKQAETPAKPLPECGKMKSVVVENATITFLPKAKFNVSAVKTPQGMGVRLESGGVAIDALRIRIELEKATVVIRCNADGMLQTIQFPNVSSEPPAKIYRVPTQPQH